MTRVADTVARCLAAAGVRHAFGMPGGEVVTLVDALAEAGIRFVLARHETAAAIMAAGAAAVTGAPGLLVTTLGPGLANAVNGIADAAQERVPLLVISGVVERSIRARYTHQILDHAALLRPLVKASFEIEAEGAAAVVARAIALAMAPPCGPVHLDLSPAVAAATDRSDGVLHSRGIDGTPAIDPADPAIADIRRLVSTVPLPGPRRRLRGRPHRGRGRPHAHRGPARHPGAHHLQGQGRHRRAAPGSTRRCRAVARGRPHPPRPRSPARIWCCSPATIRSRCGRAGSSRSRRRLPWSS